jgi:hypothetical protein
MKKRTKTKIDFNNLLWNQPVPVKKSKFIPLATDGSQYNIETDLSGISVFGLTKKYAEGHEVLYCDQQVNVRFNQKGQMGSGRSGFFKGKYIKGIGRTTLAGNWADPRCNYHSSGHLLPSAAIREFLATSYVEAKGFRDSIVGCEGILFQPIPEVLKEYSKFVFGDKKGVKLPPIDGRFLSATYKDGNFARMSNFVWLLQSMGAGTATPTNFTLDKFFSDFLFFLAPKNSGCPPHKKTTEYILNAILHAIETTKLNFITFFEIGISWNSLHNNMTLDGRFLDLETPFLWGSPMFGKFSNNVRKNPKLIDLKGLHFGTEFIFIVKELILFFELIKARLQFMSLQGLLQNQHQKNFVKEFLYLLENRLSTKRHWLYSEFQISEMITAVMTGIFNLSSNETKKMKKIISYDCKRVFRPALANPPDVNYSMLDVPTLSIEPGFRSNIFVPTFLKDRFTSFEVPIFFYELYETLEASKTINSLNDGLRSAQSRIKKYCT